MRYAINLGLEKLSAIFSNSQIFPFSEKLLFSSLATALANMLGSFLLGICIVLLTGGLQELATSLGRPNWMSHEKILQAFAVGFCGSLSTFSAFIKDTHAIYETSSIGIGLLHMGLHIGLSLFCYLLAYKWMASYLPS